MRKMVAVTVLTVMVPSMREFCDARSRVGEAVYGGDTVGRVYSLAGKGLRGGGADFEDGAFSPRVG